jgi:hypothetical protein
MIWYSGMIWYISEYHVSTCLQIKTVTTDNRQLAMSTGKRPKTNSSHDPQASLNTKSDCTSVANVSPQSCGTLIPAKPNIPTAQTAELHSKPTSPWRQTSLYGWFQVPIRITACWNRKAWGWGKRKLNTAQGWNCMSDFGGATPSFTFY